MVVWILQGISYLMMLDRLLISPQCLLPNGETTLGHVMELIEGLPGTRKSADELRLDETGLFNLVP